MTRLVARVYVTAVRALSRLAIAWTPHPHWDPLYDPDRETPEYDERDISLWCKQWVAECEAICREAQR